MDRRGNPTRSESSSSTHQQQQQQQLDQLDQLHDFSKIFNDPVHGHIELDDLCVQVIDTPQFQRLRELKQMGVSCYVFPGATHTRFEHSIGVCHLAGEMVDHLRKKQPELGITDSDARCVRLAGLCHDLGHGPFSHLFDGHFLPEVTRREASTHMGDNFSFDDPPAPWKHEQGSEMMLDYLVEQNNISSISPEELKFIKDLIRGRPSGMYPQAEKRYLFEIVANERNSVDVDKLDYIQRDCMHIGLKPSIEALRYIKFARVIDGQICYHQKEAINLCELFSVRYSLYKRVYTHKVSTAIEYMVNDILLAANDTMRISDAVSDPVAYTYLNDSILNEIERSRDPGLENARKLLARLRRRDLYRLADMVTLPASLHGQLRSADFTPEIIAAHSRQHPNDNNNSYDESNTLYSSDIIVQWLSLSYGMKHRHPLDSIRFYRKYNMSDSFLIPRNQVSEFIPENSQEIMVRVFTRDRHKTALVQQAFRRWIDIVNRDLDTGEQIPGTEMPSSYAHRDTEQDDYGSETQDNSAASQLRQHHQQQQSFSIYQDTVSFASAVSSGIVGNASNGTVNTEHGARTRDRGCVCSSNSASGVTGGGVSSSNTASIGGSVTTTTVRTSTVATTDSVNSEHDHDRMPPPPAVSSGRPRNRAPPIQSVSKKRSSTPSVSATITMVDAHAHAHEPAAAITSRFATSVPIIDSPDNVFLDYRDRFWRRDRGNPTSTTTSTTTSMTTTDLRQSPPVNVSARLTLNHGLSIPDNFEEFDSPHKRQRR